MDTSCSSNPPLSVSHTNFAYWKTFGPVQVMNGRVFADTRRRDWSAFKRLSFAAASPLIPVVRFARAVRDGRRAGIPFLTARSRRPGARRWNVLDGVGQMLGYAVGADETLRVDLVCFESHRVERNARESVPSGTPTA